MIRHKWTVIQRLHATLTLILALSAIGAGISWLVERNATKAHARAAGRREELLLAAERVRHDMLVMSDAMRGCMLNPKDEAERKRKRQADDDLVVSLRHARDLVSGNETLVAAVKAIADHDAHQLHAVEDQIVASIESDPAGAARLYASKYLPAYRDQERLLGEFTSQVTQASRLERSKSDAFHLVSLGATFVMMVTGVLLGRSISRSIRLPLQQLVKATEEMRKGDFTQRLTWDREDEFGILAREFNRTTEDLNLLIGQVQKSGIQVNASANQIAATAKQQQTTAVEIAATTNQIGATSNEISATSKELVKTMSEVRTLAANTANLAGSGQTGLARMEETIGHLTAAVASITNKLSVLNEKAGNINQVVTTITKVADQTNLLSLNAAIEAEKAGEYGRGFAVVATEIRRLADQTAVATCDIEQMVKEMQGAVSAGVMGMDKFSEEVRRGANDVQQVGSELAQIIQQVQSLTPRFETVVEGMEAQATGAQQISDGLAQLGEASQQTAESLAHSNVAISKLNEASAQLQSGVGRFRLKSAETFPEFPERSGSGNGAGDLAGRGPVVQRPGEPARTQSSSLRP